MRPVFELIVETLTSAERYPTVNGAARAARILAKLSAVCKSLRMSAEHLWFPLVTLSFGADVFVQVPAASPPAMPLLASTPSYAHLTKAHAKCPSLFFQGLLIKRNGEHITAQTFDYSGQDAGATFPWRELTLAERERVALWAPRGFMLIDEDEFELPALSPSASIAALLEKAKPRSRTQAFQPPACSWGACTVEVLLRAIRDFEEGTAPHGATASGGERCQALHQMRTPTRKRAVPAFVLEWHDWPPPMTDSDSGSEPGELTEDRLADSGDCANMAPAEIPCAEARAYTEAEEAEAAGAEEEEAGQDARRATGADAPSPASSSSSESDCPACMGRHRAHTCQRARPAARILLQQRRGH